MRTRQTSPVPHLVSRAARRALPIRGRAFASLSTTHAMVYLGTKEASLLWSAVPLDGGGFVLSATLDPPIRRCDTAKESETQLRKVAGQKGCSGDRWLLLAPPGS